METGLPPADMEAAVAARLPVTGGLRPAEIARMAPELINSSVRSALLRMVRDGRAIREGEIGDFRYRRATSGSAS